MHMSAAAPTSDPQANICRGLAWDRRRRAWEQLSVLVPNPQSTFLRTIGLNAVLASAGAPVRAGSPSLSVFRVCAFLSIVDSLGEGKSKFLAEIERLRETIR
jgi:hypothetical protein